VFGGVRFRRKWKDATTLETISRSKTLTVSSELIGINNLSIYAYNKVGHNETVMTIMRTLLLKVNGRHRYV